MNIYTRSCNQVLYNKWMLLLDRQCKLSQLIGFNGYQQAVAYLYEILKPGKGWIVNCDEDAFVVNQKAIAELIAYMQQNDFDYCGMPDGGVHPHRSRAWVTMNPFFNVFNADKIGRKLQSYRKKDIDACRFDESKAPAMPEFIRVNFNNNYANPEPFDGLFFWLSQHFKPLYLDAYSHSDGMSSMLLNHEGKPIVYHSWYSREYGSNADQTRRIDLLYNEARKA